MLLLTLILISAYGASQQPLTFLQKSSIGELSSGLEQFDENFSDFSKALEDALFDIDQQLDASISINANTGITLIENEISQLNNDLEDLTSEIEELEYGR